jgi:tRNA threonylcarbamoyladenosine biosynthesis protein TsaB
MILLIDTSQETGTAALCRNETVLFSEENKIAKEHASWLHLAIGRILSEAKITVRDLEAVAVVAGPGSYTGLRVGMAAAKGFCYALKIPLITQNTLRVMAESMISFAMEKQTLICPMIDARRDEVFTALYKLNAERLMPNAERLTPNAERLAPNAQCLTPNAERLTPNASQSSPDYSELPTANCQPPTEILAPKALILDKTAFESELTADPIVFFGSGAEKWKKITDSPNAIFQPQPDLIQSFAKLAWQDFSSRTWADPVYAEPVYLKEFFSY